MKTLTRRQLNRATLARQMLLERADVPVVGAVERLAGMQAQEPRPPFVGLWTRLEGFAAEDLRSAIRDGRLVRGTLMRGTLHLAGAPDYKAFRPTLQPVLDAAMRGVLGGRGSSDLDVGAVLEAGRELLRDGPLRFDDIRAALQKRFPDADDRSLGYAVRMGLPLVMEPSDDQWGYPRTAAFGLSDETGRAAPKRLVKSYLAAFGPASLADFQTWSGLKADPDWFDGLERFAGGLFDLPDAPRPDEDIPAPVRFLPDFDNLLLAHADRTRVIADEHRPLVATKNLRIKATFLVDGEVAGTWSVKGRKLELEPFGRLAKTVERQLADEGEALVSFLRG